MEKDVLLVTGAMKVKIDNPNKEFGSGKEYYILVNVKTKRGNSAMIGGQLSQKALLYDNKNHKELFIYIDTLMTKADEGKADADKKWATAIAKDQVGKNEFIMFDNAIETYGYQSKYSLPKGQRIVRQGKNGVKHAYALDVCCFGGHATWDATGHLVSEEWGETPLEIFTQMQNSGRLQVELFNANATMGEAELDNDE